MPTRFRRFGSALGLISLSLLNGCSTTPNVIPSTGPDTLAVYQGHIATIGEQPRMARPLQGGRTDLAGYTRDSANEIDLTFPRLPNPELVLYVFPHFSPKGRPIPGYSTSFMLYEKDAYALPGEIVP